MTKLEGVGSDPISAGSRIPRAAYILTCCIGVIGANSLLLGPIAPDVSRSLGVTVPVVMMAAAAYGLGAAISALFLAHQIDRFGAHRTLMCAMALFPVPLFACAIAPSVAVLIAAQLFAGLISGVAVPAVYANASAIAPAGLEGKTVSIVLAGWMLSLVAGVSISAFLADLVNWRAVYATTAVLATAALLLLSRVERPPGTPPRSAAMPLTALALPDIKSLLLIGVAFLTAFYGVYGYLGDYLRHGLGLSLAVNGFVALAYGLGFGSAVLFDHAVKRLGQRWSLSLVLMSIAATYLLLALAGHALVGVLTLFALLGLFNHLGMNLLILRLAAIDRDKGGAIMGLNAAATNLAAFVGASGFGPIYEAWGFAAVSYVAVALSVSALVLIELLQARARRPIGRRAN
jgi:MFS transporter, DHA1 family, inner membrane transport protein